MAATPSCVDGQQRGFGDGRGREPQDIEEKVRRTNRCIVAAIMALGRAMLVPTFKSVYETRGALVFWDRRLAADAREML